MRLPPVASTKNLDALQKGDLGASGVPGTWSSWKDIYTIMKLVNARSEVADATTSSPAGAGQCGEDVEPIDLVLPGLSMVNESNQ